MTYTEESGTQKFIKTPADWQKRREHILANLQLVMGPLPKPSKKPPLNMEIVKAVELPDVFRMKISFSAEEGDRVPAYLLIPRHIRGKLPAVLCLHQTINIGKSEPAGVGGKENLHYALELAQRGYVTLAPDYPNFGEYRFDPYKHGYSSTTMKGIWNHMRAVDLLQSLTEVHAARIGCTGHSLGGHNALFLAAFDVRIKVVVTSCGFTSFFKYRGGNLTAWSHKVYMPDIAGVYDKDPARIPFDFTEVLGVLAPRPVFINAPLQDNNFEVSGVKDCVQAAVPVYELFGGRNNLVVTYPDTYHDFPEETRKSAYDFMDKVLKTPKATPKIIGPLR